MMRYCRFLCTAWTPAALGLAIFANVAAGSIQLAAAKHHAVPASAQQFHDKPCSLRSLLDRSVRPHSLPDKETRGSSVCTSEVGSSFFSLSFFRQGPPGENENLHASWTCPPRRLDNMECSISTAAYAGYLLCIMCILPLIFCSQRAFTLCCPRLRRLSMFAHLCFQLLFMALWHSCR